MKWGVAWRNLSRYVKHDLKEIAFPSSLPNPPHFQAKPKPRKLTVKDYVYIVRTAASLHLKSFTRGGLTKEDWKKAGLDEQNDAEVAEQKEPAQPSSIEEIALAARAGAEHVKPALQRIYMTRASAYRDALKSFVEGYQEGVAEVMAKNSLAEPATSRQKSTEADEQTTRSSPAEDARKGTPLDVKASNITTHQCSKEVPNKKAIMKVLTDVEGKSYMFEFQNYDERAPARDAVSNLLARNKAGGSAPAVASASNPAKPTHGGDQLDPVEMARRMKLLQQDPDLLKLHQQLVGANVLSEVEFWATRKNLLEDEQGGGVQKQRTGLRSAMLADVRPLTDGRSNKVTFNLTPEIIHQIFAEKPAVHRAFLLYVPSKMTESAFWTKYCRAEYLYRTKNSAAAAAEAAEDEELAVFTTEDDILARSARHKIQRVDPTLDMAADLNDDYLSLPGHGVLRDGAKESVEMNEGGARKRTIIHDINRHAAVVLEGSPLDTELKDTTTVAHALERALKKDLATDAADRGAEKRRTERISIMTEMEDLQGPPQSSFVPLTIQDPRNYFDSQQSVGLEGGATAGSNSVSINPAKLLSTFKAQLKNFQTKRQRDPAIAPDVAFKILSDVTQQIASSRHTTGTAAERNILDSLPRATRDELLQHSNTANELLRHFWAAYPLTNKALSEKATRLKAAMSQLYSRIQSMKESVAPDARHQLSRLLQPMSQTLDAAITHYDGEAAKKAEAAKRARIAARPNLNIPLDAAAYAAS